VFITPGFFIFNLPPLFARGFAPRKKEKGTAESFSEAPHKKEKSTAHQKIRNAEKVKAR